MNEDQILDKTNRMNLLYDFYSDLLTEKQQTFLKYYFYEDFSLGEIAEQFQVSRQAIYEHVKRAEGTLENLESKLQLVDKHEQRQRLLSDLEQLTNQVEDKAVADQFRMAIAKLRALEA